MNAALPALVDLVIVFTLLEGLALVGWWRRSGGGVRPQDFLLNLLSGLFLMLALGAAVRQAGAAWVLACLLAAGAAHVCDLRARWRGAVPSTRVSGAPR